MSGTFIIRPTHLLSGGSPIVSFDGPDYTPGYVGWGVNGFDLDILTAVNLTTGDGNNLTMVVASVGSFSDTLRFDFSGASIYLDGSPTPIPFSSLPVGFTPQTASALCDPQCEQADPATFHIQQGAGQNGPLNNTTFDYSLPLPTMLSIVNNGIGFTANVTDVGVSVGALLNLRVEGTYDLQQAISLQTQDINTPVVAGDSVSVISPGPQDPDHPLDLTTVDTIDVVSPDGMTTISVDDFDVTFDPILEIWILIFIWPVVPDDIPFFYIVAGTQFSGSVRLGLRITIFFTNASGIYQLVPGKTSDTLYDVVDGTTVELAIPDPFAKTGYIGG